jgi:formate hydrogenlyase subunit 3/multisubunit Na+/H+ antiporter MnhD subunit
LGGIQGYIRKYPVAVFGLLISLLSISGFPLFANFPIRLAVIQKIGEVSNSALIWLLVGYACFLYSVIRVFSATTHPGSGKWQINEKISQVILIGFFTIVLITIGWFPQLITDIIGEALKQIPLMQ